MKKIIIISLILSIGLLSFTIDKETIYKVDTKNSAALWTGKKVTGEHKGAVPISSGNVVVANKQVKGGAFEFNLDALTVTDITDKESNAKLVKHLKNDDFFSTEKFPTSKFVITTVYSKGGDGDNYEIAGNLTIKGITNPISFPAVIKINAKKILASGQITINRTKFDIKFKSASFFENLGDKAIADDFILDVTLLADTQ